MNRIKQDKQTSLVIADKIIKFSEESLATQVETAKEIIKNDHLLQELLYEIKEEMADMCEEIEDKDNKIEYLRNKIGITNKEFVEEYSKINIKKQELSRDELVRKRMIERNKKHKMLK